VTQDLRTSEFQFLCSLAAGIHARPASQLAEVASSFAAECVLTNLANGSIANLKSPLSIIAANVKAGDACTIRICGNDEVAAEAALRKFIEIDFLKCDEPLAVSANGNGARTLPRFLKGSDVTCYFGHPANRGIGQGRVVMVASSALPKPIDREVASDPLQEQQRVARAFALVQSRLAEMLARHTSRVEQEILKAHLSIASDVSLADEIKKRIARGQSAGQAVAEAGEFFLTRLRQSESAYIRERALDLHDILQQLLQHIYGPKFQPEQVALKEPSIAVAQTLSPQQLLALDTKLLQALVLEAASTTTHAVILARSLGIPTLVGVNDALAAISAMDEAVVDANRGFVVPRSNELVRRFYERESATLQRRSKALARFGKARASTADGWKLEVAANVASAEELIPAFEKGAEGIGLFRTEMLFVARDSAPLEEEQFSVYVQAVKAAGGRTVILRTVDIGGDKRVPHLHLPQESNPFLGYRGVRIYQEHEALIRTQIRAILRASAFGPIKLMVPMVSSLEEVLWIKKLIATIKQELKAVAIGFDANIPLGIMIEVPSVAFIIDQLCRELDFFSIGTNDLSQYFFAADRENDKVAALARVTHPSFLRFLKQIVDEIHRVGKWVGLCGEMGSDVRNLPLLVGLQLDEISVAASEIARLKEKLSRLSASGCRKSLTKAIGHKLVSEVDNLLQHNPSVQVEQPLLDQGTIVLEAQSHSKQEAIREIIDAFYVAGRTEDPEAVEDAIWARETVYSTGLGYSFAIPHCKTDAIAIDSIGVLRLKTPVEWGALDHQPVRMVILLALRESEADSKHLQVFSKLARKLMNEEFRNRLLELADTAALISFLSNKLDL